MKLNDPTLLSSGALINGFLITTKATHIHSTVLVGIQGLQPART